MPFLGFLALSSKPQSHHRCSQHQATEQPSTPSVQHQLSVRSSSCKSKALFFRMDSDCAQSADRTAICDLWCFFFGLIDWLCAFCYGFFLKTFFQIRCQRLHFVKVKVTLVWWGVFQPSQTGGEQQFLSKSVCHPKI